MTWWIWIIAGFMLLIGEIITPGGFYIFFFGVGGLLVGLLLVLGVDISLALQILIFVITSIVFLILFNKPLRKKFAKSDSSDKVDSIVGQTAISMEEIPPNAFGKVELRGSPWNARNIGSDIIPKGQRCLISNIEGLTLDIQFVKKSENFKSEK